MTSVGKWTRTVSVVAATSRVRSNSLVPRVGSAPSRIRCQRGSSATRRGARASSARACAQRRSEVPTAACAGPRPSVTSRQAAIRSGTRIRQDTPSMARWCTTIRSRCGPVSEVNHTNCVITPVSGSNRPAAASSSACTSASPFGTWRSSASASVLPGCPIQRPGRARSSRERRTSCRSRTDRRVASSPVRSMPSGRVSSADMQNRPMPPPRASTCAAVGGSGAHPTPPPGNSARVGRSWSARPSTSSASRAIVRCSKISRVLTTMPRVLARATTWMERMLSPPPAKKSSSTPTCWASRTSEYTSARTRSVSLRGARYSTPANSGSGSAARSSFPVAVRGSRSSTTSRAGTM